MKDKRHIKSFNEATENLDISDVRSSKTNEFFGGSLDDGEVNIRIDGDDNEGKKIVIDEIKNLLDNIGGVFNLYLDGEKINSRNRGN